MSDLVWKRTQIEFYSRALKNPNQFGRYSTACKRTVTDWCARIDGKVVCGFATKRSAIAALAEG